MILLIIHIRCPRTLSTAFIPILKHEFQNFVCLNRNGDVLRKSFTLADNGPQRHAEFVTGSGDGKHVLKADRGASFSGTQSKSRFNH